MYIHTDRYTHLCLRNITFRSKKLHVDVRKVRDVQIYTHVCRHVLNTDIRSYPYTRERMHARKRIKTDRQTHGCLRECRIHDFIHTYRQVHGELPAHTHAHMHTYVRTYIINTYLLLILYVPVNSFWGRMLASGLNFNTYCFSVTSIFHPCQGIH